MSAEEWSPPDPYLIDDPRVLLVAERSGLSPEIVLRVLNVVIAKFPRFPRRGRWICFECASWLCEASGQPEPVVTQVLEAWTDVLVELMAIVKPEGAVLSMRLLPDPPESEGNSSP